MMRGDMTRNKTLSPPQGWQEAGSKSQGFDEWNGGGWGVLEQV